MSLALISILAQALTASAGGGGEVRLRGDGTATRVDTSATAQVALGVTKQRASWRLVYAPLITTLDLGGRAQQSFVLHSGTLTASFTLSPRTRFTFSESATYGQRNLQVLSLTALDATAGTTGSGTAATSGTASSSSSPTPTGTAGPVLPQARTIRYGSTLTGVSVSYLLDTRWQTLARVGYGVSGGLEAASRTFVPEVTNASVGGTLSYQVAARDSLVFGIEGSETLTQTTQQERRALLVLSTAGWNHAFSRKWSGGVSAGVSYARIDTPMAPVSVAVRFPWERDVAYPVTRSSDANQSIYPVVGADVRRADRWLGGNLALTGSGQISPFVDRMTGTVVPRATSSVGASWIRQRMSIVLGGYFLHSLNDSSQANVLQRSLGLTQSVGYRARRHWLFEVGARQLWTVFTNVDAQFTWMGYISASYTTGSLPL